jgi:ParB/RepB/Spo0J family partition protein
MMARYILVDGERRWQAAPFAGIKELDAVVLPRRPSPTELRVLQMSLDVHRTSLSAMERSDFLARIKAENNWSISELAEKLSMKQPLVTKLLKFQPACDELQAALRAGTVDQDKGYTIAQIPDHDKQRQLLNRAADLSREQIRQLARSDFPAVELKASVVRLPLPGGVLVTVRGRKMTLDDVLNAMRLTIKQLKKGQADGLDITTVSKVFADRASAGSDRMTVA